MFEIIALVPREEMWWTERFWTCLTPDSSAEHVCSVRLMKGYHLGMFHVIFFWVLSGLRHGESAWEVCDHWNDGPLPLFRVGLFHNLQEHQFIFLYVSRKPWGQNSWEVLIDPSHAPSSRHILGIRSCPLNVQATSFHPSLSISVYLWVQVRRIQSVQGRMKNSTVLEFVVLFCTKLLCYFESWTQRMRPSIVWHDVSYLHSELFRAGWRYPKTESFHSGRLQRNSAFDYTSKTHFLKFAIQF